MSVSTEYTSFICEQLQLLGPVQAKRMFGGVGLYLRTHFFGLLSNDTLYLKVDDSTRATYEEAGMGPFQPFKKKPPMRGYYEVPSDVIEDPELLASWAKDALSIARKASKK